MLCAAVLWSDPVARALDNIGGSDYGTIGPVMDYDPATDTSSPFYPIGWYFFWPTDNVLLDEVAASGGNTVLFADCKDDPTWLWSNAIAGMDRAQVLGLKIIIGLHDDLWTGIDCNTPSSQTALLRWINQFKNHPALLGWQLGDENGISQAADLNETSCVIRNVDPNNPIWQVFYTGTDNNETASLMAQSDVASFDRYGYYDTLFANPTPPFGEVDSMLYLQNMKAGAASIHGWAGNVNVAQGLGPDGNALSHFRLPSYGEYRHLVFAAIASAAARGTLSWIYFYSDGWYSDPADFTNWRDSVVQPVQLEEQMVSHAMETGWNVGTVTSTLDGQAVNGNYNKVSYLLIYDGQQSRYFLIVSNNTYDHQPVTFTLSGLPVSLAGLTAELPEESNTITMIDLGSGSYSLTDTLTDHDINIYTLPTTQIALVPTNPVDVVEYQIDTVAGEVYELERLADLSADPADWESTGAIIQGDGGTMRMYDRIESGDSVHHRLVVSAPEAVVADGLLLAFDANNDTSANDGWSYTGVMSGSLPAAGGGAAPTRHADPNGQFYFHHDAGDRVFLGNLTSSTGYGSWSSEYWVRRTGLNSENHLSAWWANSSSGNPSLISHSGSGQANPTDEIDLDHRDGNNERSNITGQNAIAWPPNEWAQIVVTYIDATGVGTDDGIMRAYYSNASGFSATPVFESFTERVDNDGPNASALGYAGLFGQNITETNRGMVGDLAVVRFYDHALTPAEIDQNFTATGPGFGLAPPVSPPSITAATVTDQVAYRFTGEFDVIYELRGSDNGTTFTPTGAMVRGAGAEQYVFDPSGTQKSAYQLVPLL